MTTLEMAQKIFSQPTAPFREGFVLKALKDLLDELQIPWCSDRWGNLLAGSSRWQTLKSPRTRLVLQAHTDHPGFHLDKNISHRESKCVWYGGAPFKDWIGARIRLVDPEQGSTPLTDGVIASAESTDYSREGMPFVARWDKDVQPGSYSFGAFALVDFEVSGDLLSSRAADDLAGCVIAIHALKNARAQNPKSTALALFTRAEEVGFVGCLKAISEMNKKLATITLEASRTLPGAEIGSGPVLRIGDRANLYDSDLSVWMWNEAMSLQKKSPQFKYQRRLMDGGSCEASAFKTAGFRASGLAVPLGNYHNAGENGQTASEIISVKDMQWAVELCSHLYLAYEQFDPPSKKFKKGVIENAKKLTPLLKVGASFP